MKEVYDKGYDDLGKDQFMNNVKKMFEQMNTPMRENFDRMRKN